MVVVLMVAEKPSLARSLAEILSKKQCGRRKSMCNACDVYEFEGSFPYGERRGVAKFKMTSVCGHVMSLDFLPKYNKWDQVDPVELYEAETMKKESIPNLRICDFLRSEGRGVDYLVLWLDCDKEGENICFEVVNEVKPVMKQPRTPDTQTVFRARFSSITEGAVVQAFRTLGAPNWNEARSVDARMELDLRVGCSFTRFQTTSFQMKYTGLNNSVISYGPCQTPTLGFCVQRHDEIQKFKPEKYWKLDAKVRHRGATASLEWCREGVFDNEVGHLFLATVREEKTARVEGVSEKHRSKAPPTALHTVEMLRSASSRLHMGPKQTMDVAERLYTEGYISYPRTETTRYPPDFDFRSILTELGRHPEFREYASTLLQSKISPPSSGTDAGDHPPITPMRSASRDQLRDGDWRLYDFITRHFLATLYPDCKYKLTEAEFSIGSERFQWSGSTPVDPGYTSVYTWHTVQGLEVPVTFEKGQEWEVMQLKLSEHQTSPPGYLTESELISLMEKHRIGTDASISVHIENICSRNYVKVDSGRRLVPTKLGIVLVHGYQKIDPELVLPTMRSAVEEQLNLIAKGKVDYDRVLIHTLDIFRKKFEYFKINLGEMDELFEASFSSVADAGRPMSRCGICRRFMKYIAAKPQRLYCANCDETYSLPQGGTIKLYKELKCPLDEFELLLFSSTVGHFKSYLVCPYCYNQPPFKGVQKGMSCSLCPHQSCLHARLQHRVDQCPDPECEKGVLVLEPHFQTGGPAPKWKLSCNSPRCKVSLSGFDGSSEVHSTGEVCSCGANLLFVDLSKEVSLEQCTCSKWHLWQFQYMDAIFELVMHEESEIWMNLPHRKPYYISQVSGLPEEVAIKKYSGCWKCDPVLSELIGDSRSEDRRRYFASRGRGRGRRKGRGRGRH